MAERLFNPAARANPKHQQAVRRVDMPEPGWFRMRLVRGGPFVPARISYGPTLDPQTGEALDRSWLWSCDINDECDWNPRPTPGANVLHVWTSGERIDQGEYDYLVEMVRHAKLYRPEAPEAMPTRAVNLRAMNPRDLL